MIISMFGLSQEQGEEIKVARTNRGDRKPSMLKKMFSKRK